MDAFDAIFRGTPGPPQRAQPKLDEVEMLRKGWRGPHGEQIVVGVIWGFLWRFSVSHSLAENIMGRLSSIGIAILPEHCKVSLFVGGDLCQILIPGTLEYSLKSFLIFGLPWMCLLPWMGFVLMGFTEGAIFHLWPLSLMTSDLLTSAWAFTPWRMVRPTSLRSCCLHGTRSYLSVSISFPCACLYLAQGWHAIGLSKYFLSRWINGNYIPYALTVMYLHCLHWMRTRYSHDLPK